MNSISFALTSIRARQRALAVIAAVSLLSACEQAPTPPAVPSDSWYQAADTETHEFIEYPSYLYRPVIPELVGEASELLGEGPLIQMSTAEAERYTGSDLKMPMNLRPFLIHGLYRGTKGFKVYFADRALWVDSLDMPGETALARRQPLVIFIDEVPPFVYVTTGATTAPQAPQAAQ